MPRNHKLSVGPLEWVDDRKGTKCVVAIGSNDSIAGAGKLAMMKSGSIGCSVNPRSSGLI